MTNTKLSKQYINLLKASLLNELYIENEGKLILTFSHMLNRQTLAFNHYFDFSKTHSDLLTLLRNAKSSGEGISLNRNRPTGASSPAPELRNILELSHTMIGKKRLENLQYCAESVLADNIPGDFMETGIWRGGACIFMRGILMAYDITDRTIWAADSFEGVPPPSLKQDAGFDLSKRVFPVLAVTLDEVRELFQRYGLLDEQVQFLKGWFKDTLPVAPIESLAILRLDGDLYESTMDALTPLYDKVTSGGFVIVDDYNSCPPCKQAISDFRMQRSISEPLAPIDGHSVYWRKQ